ncbi:MAG TPA: helix-turn-helix domain-containing protein [Solirubrobacteraceae bacterium]
MSGVAHNHARSLREIGAEVAGRLRARRPEIEGAVFARINDEMFGRVGDENAEYVAGLRRAVVAAVEFSFMGLEQRDGTAGSIPQEAVEQARLGARMGVSLDTVLRRYIAGQGLLGDFIMEEAVRSGFSGDEASLHHHLLGTQTPLLERLTASIIEAYTDEVGRAGGSSEQRRAELVRDLLAGKQLDVGERAELDYDFDTWHIGAVVVGGRAAEFIRGVKAALGCECLVVLHWERTKWVWFGRQRKPTTSDLKRLSAERPTGLSVAVGEPRKAIEGWRLTHQEAQAALLVALRKPPGVTRCSDVLLEAAVLQREPLATSLIETFLSPLDGFGYRGQTAHDTLRAYFEAKRNVSSTAHRLGVARNTVESRLREIEERLGRPLHICSAQLEVALRLEALGEDALGVESSKSIDTNWWDARKASVIQGSFEQSAQSPRSTLSTLSNHRSRTG